MKNKLKTRIPFLLALLLVQLVFSQEIVKKGTHELQMKEFGSITKSTNKSNLGNKKIIPLQTNKAAALNKIVFGFLPYWEQSSGANANMQYDRLSHLACFNFLVKFDASITPPSGWPWTTEINAAHTAGTKVVMTITNFGGSNDANAVAEELITNTSKQTTFFANIKSIIQAANLDGVNIDFEGMLGTTRDADLNTFMTALTSYIHTELPGKEVSFDAPAVLWSGWVIDGLVASVDYVVIMAYDYTSSSSANSGPVAPLIHPTSGVLSVTNTLEGSTFGYDSPVTNTPEKLVLAVPYYGQHWKTSTSAAESSTISSEGSTRFRDTETEAITRGGWIWNSGFEYPWYRWFDGANWNQVWSDNTQSIEAKFDLAIAKNLGGVGMWALNYDGTRTEFWDLIQTKFEVTASVEDSFIKNTISVYPNPTNDFINLSNSKGIKLNKVSLYNVLGKLVLEAKPKSKSINISNLTNGIYFLKVEDEIGNKGTFKILKSN
jgi:spore germination protein YaaH